MARHSLLLLVWLLLLPSLAGAQGRTIVQGEACGGDLAGTFPACTIPAEIARDSELPTQASLSVDDVITLTGQPEGSVHLGTFTGSTITDNQTIKAALQEVETAVEGATGSPGGSPGDVQYNNGGVFGGFGDFDDATNVLTLPGDVTVSGTVTATDGFEATAVDNGHTSYPPATAGESLWDTGPNHNANGSDDDCYEVRQSLTPGTSVQMQVCPDGTGELNGSPLHTNATLQSESFTILEPDAVQVIEDIVALKHFDADAYPSGVTLVDLIVTTSATCTDTVAFLERSNSGTAWTTDATVESMTLSGTRTEDDGTLTDAALDADDYLAIDLDGTTPCDIGFMQVTVTFTVN